jgi:O-antigen/teichoic acid export membrane protein
VSNSPEATARPRARSALAHLLSIINARFADESDSSLAQRVAGTAFLIRLASAALVYLTQVLLARWMGDFEFGIYVYVWTWVLLFGGLVDFGLASAAQRFIPEYSEGPRWALLRGFLFASRWLTVGIATVIAGIGCLVIQLAGPWISRYEIVPLYLACACLPLFALTRVQDGIARSYNWVDLALLPPYVLRPVLLLACMAAAYAAGFANDAVTAMTAAVIATWAAGLVQLMMLGRRLGPKLRTRTRRYDVRTWFSTAIPIFMVESFYLLLTNVDVLLLQQFRRPNEVALYYAAAKTLSLVAFVYFSVSAATAHRFAQYHTSGERERLSDFLAQSIRWTFWPSLAATIVILALGYPFLWLFGPQFVEGYPLMFILAVGLLARAAVGPAERLLNMVGEQRACAFVYMAAFLTNIVGCLILIPRFGLYGAAVATSAGVVAESALLFRVSKHRLGLHLFVWGRARPRTP